MANGERNAQGPFRDLKGKIITEPILLDATGVAAPTPAGGALQLIAPIAMKRRASAIARWIRRRDPIHFSLAASAAAAAQAISGLEADQLIGTIACNRVSHGIGDRKAKRRRDGQSFKRIRLPRSVRVRAWADLLAAAIGGRASVSDHAVCGV